MLFRVHQCALLFCGIVFKCGAASSGVSFIAVGDWGKLQSNSNQGNRVASIDDPILSRWLAQGGSINQEAVARAMSVHANESAAASSPIQCVLSLGDNFYNNGVASVQDSLWEMAFRQVYMKYGSSLRVPWHPVFGNHDYGYGAAGLIAQVSRTTSTDDDEWQFPAYNYTQLYASEDGAVSVFFIFVDTTTLAPSENKATSSSGGVSEALQARRIKDQLQRIEAALISATNIAPTWVIVVGHYPVFSPGSHGDTTELQTYLQPLLEQYKVDVYFCGHDHLSAHLSNAGVHYFVSGAGSMTDYVSTSTGAQKFYWAGEGYSAFAACRASAVSMTVSFINLQSERVYMYTISKNMTETNRTAPPSTDLTMRPTASPSMMPTAEPIPDSHIDETLGTPKWVVGLASSVILGLGACSCMYGHYLYRRKEKEEGNSLSDQTETNNDDIEAAEAHKVIAHASSGVVSPSKPFYALAGINHGARRARHRRHAARQEAFSPPAAEPSSPSAGSVNTAGRNSHMTKSKGGSMRGSLVPSSRRYTRTPSRDFREADDDNYSAYTV